MTDFEKALAHAKKFAEKNENQISEAEFETLTDPFKIEPDEMINLRAELENSGVMISDPDLGGDDDGVDTDGEDANVVDDRSRCISRRLVRSNSSMQSRRKRSPREWQRATRKQKSSSSTPT